MNEESKFTKFFCKQLITNTIKGTFLFYNNNYTFTAKYAGSYVLEVWGAQGGHWGGNAQGQSGNTGIWRYGGKGGYSKGTKSLSANTSLYIYVGGKGTDRYGGNYDPTPGAGGYNGGGSGGTGSQSWNGGSGGGGATHIATTKRGVLKNYNSYRTEVILVAGGGGGCSNHADPGAGGGTSGGNGQGLSAAGNPAGGTQTSGYAFGQGMSVTTTKKGDSCGSEGNGGGGGGYFGGYASNAIGINSDASGGGGSGYIGGVTSGTTTAGVRSGHGYATITLTRW